MPDKPKKKRPLIGSNISIGAPGPSVDGLRQLAASDPEGFMRKTQHLVDEGELALSDINLRNWFQAFYDVEVPVTVDFVGGRRAITSSAFPVMIGSMIVSEINSAYEQVPTIGQELVTDREDPKKITTIGAITSMDTDTSEVKEGESFPEINAGEQKFQIGHRRNGRKLTITAETIEENDVADIVDRCNSLAEIAGSWLEEQTLSRVCDAHGSNTSAAAAPYVLRPDGAGTALYSATSDTPGAQAPNGTRITNNALVDEEDLESAREVLASMLDSRGKRVATPMSRCVLLVPDALVGVASKIIRSEYVPGVENEVSNWGPRGLYQPRLISSPRLDDISTSAWYLGDFKKQFVRKWKLRMEYVTLSGDTQKFLDTRVAFQARLAWDVEVGARDYVYVVQNLSGTTYTPTVYV